MTTGGIANFVPIVFVPIEVTQTTIVSDGTHCDVAGAGFGGLVVHLQNHLFADSILEWRKRIVAGAQRLAIDRQQIVSFMDDHARLCQW